MTYDAHRKEGEHGREYQTVTDHLTGTAAMHPPKSRASRGAGGVKCKITYFLKNAVSHCTRTGRKHRGEDICLLPYVLCFPLLPSRRQLSKDGLRK